MIELYRRQSEEELMQECRLALTRQHDERERCRRQQDMLTDHKALHTRVTKAGDRMNAQELTARARRALLRQMPGIDDLAAVAGERPEGFEKPPFGTPEYWLAHRVGWIAEQDIAEDKALYDARRRTSLQTCHRFASPWLPRYQDKSQAYLPQLSAKIINDPALTDGARRLAFKLAEIIYRNNRAHRNHGFTVSYLARALGRCERSIQNYLRELRQRGYIDHQVVTSNKARMCIGIFIQLLRPIFAHHHRNDWPQRKEATDENGGKPGAQKDSEKYFKFSKYIVTVQAVAQDVGDFGSE